jgi:transposase
MILSGGVQMSVNESRRSYDRAFKVEAVRLSREPGRTVAGTARDLGINENMLHRWRRQFGQDSESAFPGKGHLKPEQAELGRLRRELADVTEERDILKKAMGIFSRRQR